MAKKLDDVDGLAFMILKDFIKEGFPDPDPDKQVALAYLYATSISRFRAAQEQTDVTTGPIPPDPDNLGLCTTCGTELNMISTATFDKPGAHFYICPSCKRRYDELPR